MRKIRKAEVEVVDIACDKCGVTNSHLRYSTCYGCNTDICYDCTVYANDIFYPTDDVSTKLCKGCEVTFREVEITCAAIRSRANERIDEVIEEWRKSRHRDF